MTDNAEKKKTPYGSLMTDLLFKKTFSPDNAHTKVNLLNLLNDLLGPQLLSPVTDVFSMDKEENRTGSRASRSSVFDLHCRDATGRLFVAEVQIKDLKYFVKRAMFYACQDVARQGVPGDLWNYDFAPVFVISFSWTSLVEDGRFVRHWSFCDIGTKERAGDFVSLSFIELGKFPGLGERPDDLRKWVYLFRNLDRIAELPPELREEKFERLLPTAEVSRLRGKELEEYEREFMTLEWDEYAIEETRRERLAEATAQGLSRGMVQGMAQGMAQGMVKGRRKMAQALLRQGVDPDIIRRASGLSEDEIRGL